MDWTTEFTPHMKRLKAQWEKFYSDERVLVIWDWVRDLSPTWWAAQVTYQLGHHTDVYKGPLGEIEKAAFLERDKQWEREKVRNHRDAQELLESVPMPDDVRERLAKLGFCRIPKTEGEK